MNQHVLAAVADMFFASKIRATAESLGLKITFVRNEQALMDALENHKPELVVVDLESTNIDPFTIAKRIKGEEPQEVSLLGFCSHVMTELQEQARGAGYDRILPRSAFTNKLPEILAGTSN
jgi:CheY-like chemotaxis protein